jgi:hypothetical protein
MTEVTVFGYAGAGASDAGCDPSTGCCGPSPIQVAQLVKGIVAAKFPGQYVVKYVDTFSLDAFDYGDVLQAIQEQNLSLPVLAIGGKPVLFGEFSPADAERVLREAERV